ncbi:MAG: aromatic amino acid ammonia-lyase [bacterium]|nr:aromatic amino acid ammonia-lyase [bacterium]
MNPQKVTVDGESLKVDDVRRLVDNPDVSVEISDRAWKKIRRSKNFVDQQLRLNNIVYGVNTGFGPMASHIISPEGRVLLQENLIRSHAVGIGEPIPSAYVLAAMLVRLNTLVKGYSGVSDILIKQLQFFINQRIIPIVPEHGAVGTSGDLVQLAHIALALMGEGEVIYRGRRQSAAKALRAAKIPPYRLEPREGLALINGTAVMSGIGALLCTEAERLLEAAIRLGAWSLELVHGFSDSLAENLHRLRPHPGQMKVAEVMRELLASSKRLWDREELINKTNKEEVQLIEEDVQQVYSLRCIAQILGPILDTWEAVSRTVEIEMNSVTDNPIVDAEKKQFWHGGNFHGDYVASAMDRLKAAIIKLTMLSERRINFFLNHNVNRIFPPFMNLEKPGLSLGLQGLQFVATSTTAQSQSYAFPHHLHSIPTNGDNQDVVSMGTDAALLTSKVVENAYVVLTIEVATLAQGVDFLGNKGFATSTQKVYQAMRKIFPVVKEDKAISKELTQLTAFIKQSPSLDIKNLR